MRGRIVFGLSLFCTASVAFAADLPLHFDKTTPVHHKKTAFKAKKAAPTAQDIALSLAAPSVPDLKKPSAIAKVTTPDLIQSVGDLSWVLGPMVANADGGKHEGSASATANIIVDKPGASFGPQVVVELEGHVVKTVQSTVRLDISIGEMKKTVVWKDDEIHSGIFKITLNEKVPAGVLPELIPVSAIAFVTQVGQGHVAMVSLEKVVLHFTAPQVVSTK